MVVVKIEMKDHNEVVEIIVESIKESLKDNECILLGLGGGSTANIYPDIAAHLTPEEWKRIAVYLIDERFVPKGHFDANLKLIEEKLLAHCSPMMVIAPEIHLGISVKIAIERYSEAVQGFIRQHSPSILNIYGMGPDGHIGSLFPGSFDVNSEDIFVYTYTSRFHIQRRITVGPQWCRNHESILVLNTPEKHAVFQEHMTHRNDTSNHPVNLLRKLKVLVYE
ncbi:hypothetical protein PCE1_004086 [Barthelona sp. PCE]